MFFLADADGFQVVQARMSHFQAEMTRMLPRSALDFSDKIVTRVQKLTGKDPFLKSKFKLV